MRRSSIALILLALVLSLAGAGRAIAQGAGAPAVYRDQFLVLHDKVQDALNRSKAAVASGASRRQRLVLAEELLAIQKLVHRLGEEADDTNVKGLERGRTSTKRLLLVAQGCEGLSFVMAALQNFVETEDQAFLGFATDGNSIVLNIRKLL